jgi:hypothetical protein
MVPRALTASPGHGGEAGLANASTGVTPVLAYVMVLAAALTPVIGDAAVVPICGALGAFIGATLARVRRLPRATLRELTEDGAYAGAALGTCIYLLAALDLISI